MSALSVGADEGHAPFRIATVMIMVAVGVAAFVAMLVLGAYSPELRSTRNGGSHALSTGATGFAALVELARATGRNPRIIRNPAQFDSEDLVVLTPESGRVNLDEVLNRRGPRATLVVLPKWNTVADPAHPGWVRVRGVLYEGDPERTLAPAWKLDVHRERVAGTPLATAPAYQGRPLQFSAPGALQTVSGDKLKPFVVDPHGHVVVGQLGNQPLYLLADPDLLSNRGMADLDQARAALELLDFLNATGSHGIAFDVTLNGFGRSKSPLKLIFDPPFVATTLALAVAMLLAAAHAATRFGPARRPRRALAFGKAALVDNTAALVRKARREAVLGARYAAVVRERALAYFGAAAGLGDREADALLDRLGGARSFSELARRAAEAGDRHELLAAARALHEWQREILA